MLHWPDHLHVIQRQTPPAAFTMIIDKISNLTRRDIQQWMEEIFEDTCTHQKNPKGFFYSFIHNRTIWNITKIPIYFFCRINIVFLISLNQTHWQKRHMLKLIYDTSITQYIPPRFFEFHNGERLRITPLLLSKSRYLKILYELNVDLNSPDNVIQLQHKNTDDASLSALHKLLTTTPCNILTFLTDTEELNTYEYVIDYYMLSEWDQATRTPWQPWLNMI